MVPDLWYLMTFIIKSTGHSNYTIYQQKYLLSPTERTATVTSSTRMVFQAHGTSEAID